MKALVMTLLAGVALATSSCSKDGSTTANPQISHFTLYGLSINDRIDIDTLSKVMAYQGQSFIYTRIAVNQGVNGINISSPNGIIGASLSFIPGSATITLQFTGNVSIFASTHYVSH